MLALQYPRDPDDEPILNLAIQEQVDYLVTRDRDLLDLGRSVDFRLRYPFIRVVDPLTFVQDIERDRMQADVQKPEQNSQSLAVEKSVEHQAVQHNNFVHLEMRVRRKKSISWRNARSDGLQSVVAGIVTIPTEETTKKLC